MEAKLLVDVSHFSNPILIVELDTAVQYLDFVDVVLAETTSDAADQDIADEARLCRDHEFIPGEFELDVISRSMAKNL
jgi:hypothetical protein